MTIVCFTKGSGDKRAGMGSETEANRRKRIELGDGDHTRRVYSFAFCFWLSLVVLK
jgi:hypothetical protein